MRIETARLVIRPFAERDIGPFAEMNADPLVMRFFPAPYPVERSTAQLARFASALAADGFAFAAAEDRQSGDFVGMIGIIRMEPEIVAHLPGKPEIEIGWRLRSRFWGLGLAPEGARACLEDAWTRLGLDEIIAYTAARNTPSQRVMEKIGMHRDPVDDFLHPRIAAGHPLRPQVLYRIRRADQSKRSAT